MTVLCGAARRADGPKPQRRGATPHNNVLNLKPEMLSSTSGIELGSAFGQPKQSHAEPFRQVLRSVCRMTAIAIQQQRDVPAAVLAMHPHQKCLEIFCTLMQPGLKQAMPGSEIYRTKH